MASPVGHSMCLSIAPASNEPNATARTVGATPDCYEADYCEQQGERGVDVFVQLSVGEFFGGCEEQRALPGLFAFGDEFLRCE